MNQLERSYYDEDAEFMTTMPPILTQPAHVGRSGEMLNLGGFQLFVDTLNYDPAIITALRQQSYESNEFRLVKKWLQPTDRVIEGGTAIGVISMAAASIVGAPHVMTFDANPAIVADAQANFANNGLSGIQARAGILKNRQHIEANNPAVDFFISREFWRSRLSQGEDHADIVAKISVSVFCLEDEIARHNANVIICDIEGGEVDLFDGADLSAIRLIIVETHDWLTGLPAVDALVRRLVFAGFTIDVRDSGNNVAVFRRVA
ncbi:MAG: FkbM family methyltransferase [Acidocella sp.]|nr:FkbM family methyltransferase [Acidocella sp.]